jgi:hypothetical protein
MVGEAHDDTGATGAAMAGAKKQPRSANFKMHACPCVVSEPRQGKRPFWAVGEAF